MMKKKFVLKFLAFMGVALIIPLCVYAETQPLKSAQYTAELYLKHNQNLPFTEKGYKDYKNFIEFSTGYELRQSLSQLKETYYNETLKLLNETPEHLQEIEKAYNEMYQIQIHAHQSCKISGKVIARPNNQFMVPIICTAIPKINHSQIDKLLEASHVEPYRQLVLQANLLKKSVKIAPQIKLNTAILIHKQNHLFIPEMNNPNYYPATVNRLVLGNE